MALTKAPEELLDKSLTSALTVTVDDNSDTLTIVSTDADDAFGPFLNLHRNSSSPADNDGTGVITFAGENDNNEEIDYAQIQTASTDVSDGSEDGTFIIQTMVAGTSRDRITLSPSETAVNENSVDLDFRVESDSNSHMLFVDAAEDHVNIGTSSDLGGVFNIFGTGAGNARVVIEGEGGADPSLNFLANNTTHFTIGIDDSDSDSFKISQHSAFGTNDFVVVDTSGDFMVGTTSPAAESKLHVEVATSNPNSGSPTNSSALMVNGGTTTEGTGPVIALRNISGSKETIARFCAETTSNNNGDLTISVYGGGATVDEKLRIQSGGGISFNGDTAAANALDDYEEGAWTPVLTAATSAPTVSLTHVSGYYVKIGSLVYIRFGMYVGSISGGSGALRITGLPFAGKTYSSYRQPAAISNTQNLTSDPDGPVILFLLDGDTKLEGRLFNNADTAVPISHFQAGSWCIANFSYDVS